MCGRYADPREEEIIDAFGVQIVNGHKEPSLNVAPTDVVSIVVDPLRDDGPLMRELWLARWGLVPSWTKTIDRRSLLINARSETITVKPSFRSAAGHRRAIVPATGYYEWALQPNGKKVPYFLHSVDDSVLGFAGLYEWWRVPEGTTISGVKDGWLCSTTIITRPATDALGHIHDRMPVVVPTDLIDAWLNPTITSRAQVDDLLAAMPDPELTV